MILVTVRLLPSGVSHPARGAWIEMANRAFTMGWSACRTPQGVRGLKLTGGKLTGNLEGSRTPQGVRGLK